MQNQKNENIKKILIAVVVLALFGTSYYYYASGEQETQLAQKPVKAKKAAKVAVAVKKAPEKIAEKKTDPKIKEEVKQEKTKKPEEKKENKIKPTAKKDIIARAVEVSGKSDPFSYAESRFRPFKRGASGGRSKRMAGLPHPPQSSEKPSEAVIIKGFMGNKVIAEIKGITEILAVNESHQGVKALNVDPANLTCVFEINGKKVTRTMKPLTQNDNGVKVNYIDKQ